MKTHNLLSPIIILFLLATSVIGCKSYQMRRMNSFEQIELLKNNALIVRLNTSDNKIKALNEASLFERAEKEILKIEQKNQQIIAAFNKYYDFSKVYFIHPSESDFLKQKKYEYVHLKDGSDKPVSDKSFLSNVYFVASFGLVYQEQFIHEDSENQRYSLGGYGSLPALVIMDSDYIQLRKPFPFRIITASHEDYIKDAVKALNYQLQTYYRKKVKKSSRRK